MTPRPVRRRGAAVQGGGLSNTVVSACPETLQIGGSTPRLGAIYLCRSEERKREGRMKRAVVSVMTTMLLGGRSSSGSGEGDAACRGDPRRHHHLQSHPCARRRAAEYEPRPRDRLPPCGQLGHDERTRLARLRPRVVIRRDKFWRACGHLDAARGTRTTSRSGSTCRTPPPRSIGCPTAAWRDGALTWSPMPTTLRLGALGQVVWNSPITSSESLK